MNKSKIIVLTLSFIAIFALYCTAANAAPKHKLNLFIWSEYLDPEIVTAFEKKYDCKVNIDLYEDNESMLAKLAGGGTSLYDLIVPSDYVISVLVNRGLIKELDKSKLSNFKNLNPKFINQDFDPNSKYSIPYQWGTVGIYLRKKPDQVIEETWGLVFDPKKQPGQFVMIDSMREAISAAMLYSGFGVNETDPAKLKIARDLLTDAKKRSIGMDGGVGGKNKVLANNATMAIVYNGDALRGMAEDPETYYFVPKEGGELWIDSLAIPAKAPNLDMAYKFIDYILEAEVGAQLSNFNQYGTPNKAALPKINPDDLKNPAIYPSEEIMKRLQTLKDLGADTKLYDEIWTQIKG